MEETVSRKAEYEWVVQRVWFAPSAPPSWHEEEENCPDWCGLECSTASASGTLLLRNRRRARAVRAAESRGKRR